MKRLMIALSLSLCACAASAAATGSDFDRKACEEGCDAAHGAKELACKTVLNDGHASKVDKCVREAESQRLSCRADCGKPRKRADKERKKSAPAKKKKKSSWW